MAKTITDDTDEIVLNDAAYNLYEHECAVTIAEQASGGTWTEWLWDIKIN